MNESAKPIMFMVDGNIVRDQAGRQNSEQLKKSPGTEAPGQETALFGVASLRHLTIGTGR